jgi:hypothetical protein
VYNRQNNSLTFENCDFDIKNAGLLVSVGGCLFKSAIRSTIKAKIDTAVVEHSPENLLGAVSW